MKTSQQIKPKATIYPRPKLFLIQHNFELVLVQLAVRTIKYRVFLKRRVFRQGTSVIQVTAADQDTINEPVTYEIVGCKYRRYQAYILFLSTVQSVCRHFFIFPAFFSSLENFFVFTQPHPLRFGLFTSHARG